MPKIFTKFSMIIFVGLVLSACGSKPSDIVIACQDGGGSAKSCQCVSDSLEKVLSADVYSAVSLSAQKGGAPELTKAMLELTEQQKHLFGTEMSLSCAELEFEKPEESAEVALSDADGLSAVSSACQVDGNTPSMCECWAAHVKKEVSPEIFVRLMHAANENGNEGLNLAVHALSDQDQMSVGLVFMDAGVVCAAPQE